MIFLLHKTLIQCKSFIIDRFWNIKEEWCIIIVQPKIFISFTLRASINNLTGLCIFGENRCKIERTDGKYNDRNTTSYESLILLFVVDLEFIRLN